MNIVILFAILVSAYLMAMAKRVPSLLSNFRYQSFFLFLMILVNGFSGKDIELCFVALLILILKVIVIPHFLYRTAKRINVDENLGLIVNPQLSLIAALIITYFSWVFSRNLALNNDHSWMAATVSLATVFIGGFLMISRLKAFTQVTGLLVMENGIFLLASSISGGMPFFVEIAIFFDVFISVIVMGLFVYRINKLFTHIDVNKLSELKG
jgi:hydrogenase-4 component E